MWVLPQNYGKLWSSLKTWRRFWLKVLLRVDGNCPAFLLVTYIITILNKNHDLGRKNNHDLRESIIYKMHFTDNFFLNQWSLVFYTSILLHLWVIFKHFPSSQVNSDSLQALMRSTCELVWPWVQALFSISQLCFPTGRASVSSIVSVKSG